MGHCHRGDPFSHPSGSSARYQLRSFSRSWSSLSFLLLKASGSLSFSSLCFRAHPATAGPENLQCRFAFIQLVRALVSPAPLGRAPASNTLLTRDTVESPAKPSPAVPLPC